MVGEVCTVLGGKGSPAQVPWLRKTRLGIGEMHKTRFASFAQQVIGPEASIKPADLALRMTCILVARAD